MDKEMKELKMRKDTAKCVNDFFLSFSKTQKQSSAF